MGKQMKNILSLVLFVCIVFLLSANITYAEQGICRVTFKNNSNSNAVFLADGVNHGVVYAKRSSTFMLNKVNYQRQPYHIEIRVDVNRNGHPVTVKEAYIDLSNTNRYTFTYP